MTIERRENLSELVIRVEKLEETSFSSYKALATLQQEIAEQKTRMAVQGEQVNQILSLTRKIELGLWGAEGQGGVLGELQGIKDKQNTLSGWVAGLGASVLAAIGASIGAFFRK